MCLARKDLVKLHPDIRIVYPVHLNPNVRTTVNALLQNTNRIHLTEPLKSLGEFSVPIRLHRDVTATVQVVIAKEAGDEEDKETPEE